MLAAISEGTWAFLGVLITNIVVLVGLFLRQGKQGKSINEVNLAVNHQVKDAPTLIQRVIVVESRVEDFQKETVVHRDWERQVFAALARHVGFDLPPHETSSFSSVDVSENDVFNS